MIFALQEHLCILYPEKGTVAEIGEPVCFVFFPI